MIKIQLNTQTVRKKQLRNTFELSQLDGVGMQLMEKQEFRDMKEREKENLLGQFASTFGTSIAEARATQQFQTSPSSPQIGSTPYQSPPSTTQRSTVPFQSPPSTTQRNTAPFQSPTSPPPYSPMFSRLPPQSSQRYGLLLGPGSGQQTHFLIWLQENLFLM